MISYSATSESAQKSLKVMLILASLAVLAFVLSRIVLKLDVYYVIILGLAVVAAIIVSSRFEYGLFAYFLIAPFVIGAAPALMGANASYQAGVMPSQVGLVLLGMLWLTSQFFGDGIKLIKTRLNTPVLVFFGVAAASTISSYFIWDPRVHRYDKELLYHLTEVGLWVLCVAAFFLVANSAKRKVMIRGLYWPILLVGLYAGFFQITKADMPIAMSRGTFMIAFAAIMTAARVFFGKDRKAVKAIFGLLLAVLITSILWDRSWISGWMAAGLGVGMVTYLYSKKLFAVLAVVALFGLFVYPGIYTSMSSESKQQGDMDRFIIWSDSTNMAVQNNPLLGIGPADYLAYSRKYASVWYGNTTYTNAHSDFAQMIAEMGLFGIAAFLWLVIAGIKTGMDSIRKSRDNKWLAVGGTAVFAAMAISSLIGDYLLPSRVNGGIWSFGTSVFPWLLLGVAVASARTETEEEPLEVEV